MQDDPNEALPTSNNIPDILEFLKRHDVVKVVVRYSGGHDSGDIEETRITLTTGESYVLNAADAVPAVLSAEWLHEALESPIWEHYGSFAGEYSAYGELIWDVTDGHVFFEGVETTDEPMSDTVFQ